MDLILENVQPEQASAFKKLAKLLNIKVKIKNQMLSDEQEEVALGLAIQESAKDGLLNEAEKNAFIQSLSKK
jgi:hypothetical protein